MFFILIIIIHLKNDIVFRHFKKKICFLLKGKFYSLSFSQFLFIKRHCLQESTIEKNRLSILSKSISNRFYRLSTKVSSKSVILYTLYLVFHFILKYVKPFFIISFHYDKYHQLSTLSLKDKSRLKILNIKINIK